MVLIVYSAKSQPFGLLSNNARIPLNIDGGTYSTVTEYVYVNLFKSAAFRERMSKNLLREPFPNAVKLREEEDDAIYQAAVEKGMSERFKQYPRLRALLYATRGTDLRFPQDVIRGKEFDRLKLLLNRLRAEPNVVFDPLLGEVPFEEVNEVINGTVRELYRNPQMQPMPYNELRDKFRVKQGPIRKEFIRDLMNLNEIVPMLKKHLGKKIYEDETKKFKAHLLDVYLDYILENEYPLVRKEDYGLAKRQQIRKERNVDKYEDQLLELYNQGELDYSVTKRLTFLPSSTDLIEEGDEELADVDAEVDEIKELSRVSLHRDLTIVPPSTDVGFDSPFFPHYPEQVSVDGKIYRTVITYAYAKLFGNLGIDFDVNGFADLGELAKEYARIKNLYMVDKISENNEKAARTKFSNINNSLRYLLIWTRKEKLVWNDKTDQVLGADSNRAGIFWEYLRDVEFPATRIRNLKIPDMSSYGPSISATYIFRSWLAARAEDYANTLNLLKNPTTKDLELIYRVDVTTTAAAASVASRAKITEKDAKVMEMGGLSAKSQSIVYPLIYTEYHKRYFKEKENLAILSMIDFYDQTKPDAEIKRRANEYLRGVYDKVTAIVPKEQFVTSILSQSSPTNDKSQEQWWRINYWGKELPLHRMIDINALLA